jgi:hypothetical protein
VYIFVYLCAFDYVDQAVGSIFVLNVFSLK